MSNEKESRKAYVEFLYSNRLIPEKFYLDMMKQIENNKEEDKQN